MRRLAALAAGAAAVLAVGSAGCAAAQTDTCSSSGGFPEGSPGALMARLRGLESGAYAACVERERRRHPRMALAPSEQASRARAAVLARLRASQTAVFRDVRRMAPPGGPVTFCGEVNAQNGLGGMSGFVRFQAAVNDRGEATAWLDSQDAAVRAHFQAGWRRACALSDAAAVRF